MLPETTRPKKKRKLGVTQPKKSVDIILLKSFTGEIIPLRLWPYVKRRQFDFISWSPLVFSGSHVRNLLETFQCCTKLPITFIDLLPYQQWEEWHHPSIHVTDLDNEWANLFALQKSKYFLGKKRTNFLGIMNPHINVILPLLLILETGK